MAVDDNEIRGNTAGRGGGGVFFYDEAPEELTRALEQPFSACIEDSVQRNQGFFADILFPIMGPAIRRSISQALKGLVQQINQTLEHSLTVKGLRWRLEAARSGVPFAEVVTAEEGECPEGRGDALRGKDFLLAASTGAPAEAYAPPPAGGLPCPPRARRS